MKLRFALALLGLTACQGGSAPQDLTVTADTSVPVEVGPDNKVAPTEPRKPARFVMVGPKTNLRAGASHDAAIVEVTEPAMVLAVDAEQPDNPTWVRLVQTPLKSRCGYPSLQTTTAVYAERNSLLQTLTEDFVYEVPGKTEARVVLRAGVALLARDKQTDGGTDYEIAIVPPRGGNRVRATLPLDAPDLPRVINGAQLTAALPDATPEPAASTSGPPAPSAAPSAMTPKKAALAAVEPSPSRIAVGKYVVRLPKSGAPRVDRDPGPKSGTDRITLKTGCLEVVGYAPSAAGLAGLLAAPVPMGVFAPSGLSDGFTTRGLEGLVAAKGVQVGSGGLGMRGTGRGGGGTGMAGLGRMGRVDAGGGSGRGYGSGRPSKGKPQVHVGSALIRGSLPATGVRRAIVLHKGSFLACYEKGRAKTPDLSGRVLMELKVDAKGHVTSARAIPKSQSVPNGTDLPDASVVSCVTRTLLGASFPAPSGEGTAVILVPLRFSP